MGVVADEEIKDGTTSKYGGGLVTSTDIVLVVVI